MQDHYDDVSIEDVISASEMREMDQDTEYRLDAEDDARNTAAVQAGEATTHDDGEPWLGLADGEER
ncbi:hypothetical protein ACIOHE_15735 [Streptomyces sp. NPDC087851]|uniref:hypothetical protein n=1 Tax=Streptomyces sp. NPDC087851 TaxID=3365810 RepID=UPI00380459DD